MQVDVYYEENDNVGAGVGSVENTTLVFNLFVSYLLSCLLMCKH